MAAILQSSRFFPDFNVQISDKPESTPESTPQVAKNPLIFKWYPFLHARIKWHRLPSFKNTLILMCSFKYLGIFQSFTERITLCSNCTAYASIVIEDLFQSHVKVTVNFLYFVLSAATSTHFCLLTNWDPPWQNAPKQANKDVDEFWVYVHK